MRLLSRYKWLPSWEPRPPAVDLVARAPTDGSARSTATKADPALLGVIPCFPACAPRALPPASFLARAARKTCPAVSKTQLVARCRLPLRRLLQLRRQDLLEVAAGAERRLWWWWLVVVVAIASCMTGRLRPNPPNPSVPPASILRYSVHLEVLVKTDDDVLRHRLPRPPLRLHPLRSGVVSSVLSLSRLDPSAVSCSSVSSSLPPRHRLYLGRHLSLRGPCRRLPGHH